MSRWIAVYRVAWGILGILFLLILVCVFVPKCQRLHEESRKKAALEAGNRRIEAAIKELRSNQERFATDPAFVERTGREIGMAKPGEVVYRYTNEAVRTSAPPRQGREP